MTLTGSNDETPSRRLGQQQQRLWERNLNDTAVQATLSRPGSTYLLGAGYEYEYQYQYPSKPCTTALAPHRPFIEIRLDRGALYGSARIAYANTMGEHQCRDWSYSSKGVVGQVKGGYAWDWRSLRMGLAGLAGFGWLDQTFPKSDKQGPSRRDVWPFRFGGGIDLLYPATGVMGVEASLSGAGL